MVWLSRDITDRVNTELERRIAAIAFESQQGMLITDAQNRILRVNGAFSRISGYSAAEAIGQTTALLASGRHGPDFYRSMWSSIEATGVGKARSGTGARAARYFPSG